MALGPFARIVAQFVMVAGGAVTRAVRSAYKEAAKESNKGAALMTRNRMRPEEARKILEVPAGTVEEEVVQKTTKMMALNEVDAKGIGSP